MRAAAWLFAVAVTWVADDCHGKLSCDVCTGFVDKFKEGMGRTKGKSSGSGNTDWEESRGIKYSTSEARLIEVLETACSRSDMKCLNFLEEHEEFLEDWFIGKEVDLKSMRRVFCVEESKLCCEEGFFGAKCTPCPGGSDTPCSGHGKCKGSGDRRGKGKCTCDEGYIGKRCAKCAPLHYNSGSAESPTCDKCNAACAKSCTGPGQKDCAKCAPGFDMAESEGCIDVDECVSGTANCTDPGVYCVNTDGSFECSKCDQACHPDDGCTGPGPMNCAEKSCADGYIFSEEAGCADDNECEAAESPCGPDEFCTNLPGSHKCSYCSDACAEGKGCIDGSPLGCRECKEGYKVPQGRDVGCEDVDECVGGGNCKEEFTCVNSAGSFTCQCQAPKHEVDGACVLPTDAPDTDKTKDEL